MKKKGTKKKPGRPMTFLNSHSLRDGNSEASGAVHSARPPSVSLHKTTKSSRKFIWCTHDGPVATHPCLSGLGTTRSGGNSTACCTSFLAGPKFTTTSLRAAAISKLTPDTHLGICQRSSDLRIFQEAVGPSLIILPVVTRLVVNLRPRKTVRK